MSDDKIPIQIRVEFIEEGLKESAAELGLPLEGLPAVMCVASLDDTPFLSLPVFGDTSQEREAQIAQKAAALIAECLDIKLPTN